MNQNQKKKTITMRILCGQEKKNYSTSRIGHFCDERKKKKSNSSLRELFHDYDETS